MPAYRRTLEMPLAGEVDQISADLAPGDVLRGQSLHIHTPTSEEASKTLQILPVGGLGVLGEGPFHPEVDEERFNSAGEGEGWVDGTSGLRAGVWVVPPG